MILKNIFFLTFSAISSFHITTAHDHICDFNDEIPLTFQSKQNSNNTKTCKLEPAVMDRVIIKCGSDKLKYKLDPPNCLQEVYETNTLVNKKKIHDVLEGASSIMIRKNPEDFNDVSLRIPPNIFENKHIFCSCINEKTIRIRKNNEESNKLISNTGIVEIVIPTLKEKMLGCDFSNEASSLFTKGYDHSLDLSKEENKITCKIPLKGNTLIGFKCPKNSHIKPEDCFVSGYNTKGELENLQNTFGFTELIMDHYNNTFYSRLPNEINKEASFFCLCLLEEKKFVAYFYSGSESKQNENIVLPTLSVKKSSSNFVNMSLLILFLYFVSFSFIL